MNGRWFPELCSNHGLVVTEIWLECRLIDFTRNTGHYAWLWARAMEVWVALRCGETELQASEHKKTVPRVQQWARLRPHLTQLLELEPRDKVGIWERMKQQNMNVRLTKIRESWGLAENKPAGRPELPQGAGWQPRMLEAWQESEHWHRERWPRQGLFSNTLQDSLTPIAEGVPWENGLDRWARHPFRQIVCERVTLGWVLKHVVLIQKIHTLDSWQRVTTT